jgi:uncharacterized protein
VKNKLSWKLRKLKEILKDMNSVAVAYSGGVDSSFLLKIAYDVLGDKVLAVTATSSTYPKQELTNAKKFAKNIGVKHIIIGSDEIKNKKFSKNTPNRCYYCKKELFTKIKKIADKNDINYVLDGENADDTKDYRPGIKAARELCVRSPLKEAGLTKKEIRELSHKMNLKTWDKPALACLASRFPYGTRITKERLKQVELAEAFLSKMGLHQIRVRHHEKIARIEVTKNDFNKILRHKEKIVNYFKKLGFIYVTMDIEGYRTGSLNEGLKHGKAN